MNKIRIIVIPYYVSPLNLRMAYKGFIKMHQHYDLGSINNIQNGVSLLWLPLVWRDSHFANKIAHVSKSKSRMYDLWCR